MHTAAFAGSMLCHAGLVGTSFRALRSENDFAVCCSNQSGTRFLFHCQCVLAHIYAGAIPLYTPCKHGVWQPPCMFRLPDTACSLTQPVHSRLGRSRARTCLSAVLSVVTKPAPVQTHGASDSSCLAASSSWGGSLDSALYILCARDWSAAVWTSWVSCSLAEMS